MYLQNIQKIVQGHANYYKSMNKVEETEKAYCSRFGRASKIGATSSASRPAMMRRIMSHSRAETEYKTKHHTDRTEKENLSYTINVINNIKAFS